MKLKSPLIMRVLDAATGNFILPRIAPKALAHPHRAVATLLLKYDLQQKQDALASI